MINTQKKRATKEEYQKTQLFWQRNPIRFLIDCLDVKEEFIWPKMVEVAESVRDNQRTCIEAGHSVSKDYEIARLALWFLSAYGPFATVIVTGPGDNQVENIFFKEVAVAYHNAKIPYGGNLTSCKLDMACDDKRFSKWLMLGFVSKDDPGTDENTRMLGFHNQYVLLIFTEAAGVPNSVWKAAEGLIISENHRWVVYGNPTKAQGPFADAAQDPAFHYINIAVTDTPNYKEGREVIPGVSGRAYVEGIEKKYGKDSNEYLIRVLGRRPEFTQGTYLGRWLSEAESSGRINDIGAKYDNTFPVFTVWDYGNVYNAIWFVQIIKDEPILVDFFYDCEGRGLPFYAQVLQEKKYIYAGHFAPPDLWTSNAKSGQTGDVTVNIAKNLGIKFTKIEVDSVADRIEAARAVMPKCRFSPEVEEGVSGLRDWRMRRNDALSTPTKTVYYNDAVKSWGRHVGDSFSYFAVAYRNDMFVIKTNKRFITEVEEEQSYLSIGDLLK